MPVALAGETAMEMSVLAAGALAVAPAYRRSRFDVDGRERDRRGARRRSGAGDTQGVGWGAAVALAGPTLIAVVFASVGAGAEAVALAGETALKTSVLGAGALAKRSRR